MAHGVLHFTLTLSGAAQALSSVLGSLADDIPCDAIILEPAGANVNRVYVGGVGTTLDGTDYGFSLPPGDSGAPPPPFVLPTFGRATRLSQWQVLGTAAQVLHILVIER